MLVWSVIGFLCGVAAYCFIRVILTGFYVVRPDQREPWKNYMYTFEPGTCGIGNRLDG